LWANAVTAFGLAPRDAWRLTLREYHYLSKSHEAGAKREHYRFALVCSVIANAHRSKGKPFKPDDFMPRERRKKQTWQEQLQVLQQFVASYGDKKSGGDET
jgi:hypothetical protein